jgi:hypothetical protein
LGPSVNSGRKPFRFYALLPVTDHASAREAARAGAIAGFLVAAVNVLFFIATLLGYPLLPVTHDRDPQVIAPGLEEITGSFAVILAFLSWRILTGRGYISAVFSAILVALELAFIFMIRHSDVAFVGLILFKFGIDGVRGTWWLRRNRRTPDPDVFA